MFSYLINNDIILFSYKTKLTSKKLSEFVMEFALFFNNSPLPIKNFQQYRIREKRKSIPFEYPESTNHKKEYKIIFP